MKYSTPTTDVIGPASELIQFKPPNGMDGTTSFRAGSGVGNLLDSAE